MKDGVDLALAVRLERAEGLANAAYVDARREVQPEIGAEWTEVSGVLAMFDGVGSPITQTFGLGLDPSLDEAGMGRLEEFFARHGAVTAHEVCSFANPAVLSLLSARRYSPIEASVVLVRPTAQDGSARPGAVTVRIVEDAVASGWARVAGQGWGSESAELAGFVEDFGRVIARARGVQCFLAELDGVAIAAGALNISNGIALLAGASTIPAARRQGAQRALLEARLAFSAALGIDLAMVVTAPGSASQRNAERQGFRPIYTRAKWQKVEQLKLNESLPTALSA